MKSVFFVLAWCLLSVGVVFTTVAGFTFYQENIISLFEKNKYENNVLITSRNRAEESAEILGATTISESEDARAVIVANFLKRYNTPKPLGVRKLDHPLVPEDYFGKFFVELADEYNLDFRLLPAIAMQESNLCVSTPRPLDKNGNVVESYNCLGFGVYGKKVTMFPSFEANFEQAAKTLKKNYIDIGLDTPYKIMKKYTPPSDGSWAESVNQWMTEMRYDDRSSGIKLKENTDLLEFVDTTESGKSLIID
ncbi:glucosaminidase domain-containing protein [Patescibacteria group bacterium]|nr:glucosaminidase domain-containing protein [Patescibacteria group bacterium]